MNLPVALLPERRLIMKNRYFLLFVGILCLCGLMFFVVSRLQEQAPVTIYTATPFPEISTMDSPSDSTVRQNADYTATPFPEISTMDSPSDSTVRQNADAPLQKTVPKPDENEAENELLLAKAKFEQLEQSPEYQAFLQAKMQEWKNRVNQGKSPDFSFQEILDFYTSQGIGSHVDFAQESLEAFREYFPTGDPEDYDAEMVARFQEIFAVTPGTPAEASLSTSEILYAEPDFAAWILGRFKGELTPHMQWIDEQTAIAAHLENSPLPPPTEVSPTGTSGTDVEMTLPTTPAESPQTPPRESGEASQSNIVNTPFSRAPLPIERISSLRETLRRYGTDEGLLHLLEIDGEGAGWLLDNFNSLDEINAWLSETSAEAPPANQRPQRLPTEETPWSEIPK